jgi:hypothetical protein
MKILSIETEDGIAGYQSRFGGAVSLLRPRSSIIDARARFAVVIGHLVWLAESRSGNPITSVLIRSQAQAVFARLD